MSRKKELKNVEKHEYCMLNIDLHTMEYYSKSIIKGFTGLYYKDNLTFFALYPTETGATIYYNAKEYKLSKKLTILLDEGETISRFQIIEYGIDIKYPRSSDEPFDNWTEKKDQDLFYNIYINYRNDKFLRRFIEGFPDGDVYVKNIKNFYPICKMNFNNYENELIADLNGIEKYNIETEKLELLENTLKGKTVNKGVFVKCRDQILGFVNYSMDIYFFAIGNETFADNLTSGSLLERWEYEYVLKNCNAINEFSLIIKKLGQDERRVRIKVEFSDKEKDVCDFFEVLFNVLKAENLIK